MSYRRLPLIMTPIFINHPHPPSNRLMYLFKKYNYKPHSSPGASSLGHSGGGAGKGRRACNHIFWNLNICIEKVDTKCWLAEMTLLMTSLPLACVFQCLFIFALISAWCWLTEIWQLSRWGTTGELEKEFKFQRRSCKLSFLLLPRCQSAPEILHVG